MKFYTDSKKRVRPLTKRNASVHTMQTGVAHLSIPHRKKPTLLDSRIQTKINQLIEMRNRSLQDRNDRMVVYYQTQIDDLRYLQGKTRKQVRDIVLEKGDAICSARATEKDFDRLVRQEHSLEIMEKITGFKYSTPKYNLAQGKDQSANIIGYRPQSEKLVYMTPQQYLLLTPPTTYSQDSLSKLRQRIRLGEPIDALWLDVDVNTGRVLQHEGRHRAKVAQDFGIEKIPVVLYAKDKYDWEKSDKLPKVEELKRQLH